MNAALTVVRRSGTRVPMATIAAQANVGIGTLYRHFGGRDEAPARKVTQGGCERRTAKRTRA